MRKRRWQLLLIAILALAGGMWLWRAVGVGWVAPHPGQVGDGEKSSYFPPFMVRAGEEKAKGSLDVPALTEKLKDKDDLVRRSALAALANAGKDAKNAIPSITDLLKDKDPIVRIYAASALRTIDPQTKLALPVLLDAFRVKDDSVRCFAAVAFNGYDPTAVPALIEMFREKDGTIHMWLSGAIIGIGKKAEPFLLKACDDPDPIVRTNVIDTLKSLTMIAD